MAFPKPLQSVLVKPAGPDCNLACEYCFYLAKSRLFTAEAPHRMSPEILTRLVSQVMQAGTQVSFGWQGGEPTLMGMAFYERAVGLQQQYSRPGQSCSNGFQTNGILVDDAWARFFRDADFLVGLSLDGPARIHDRYRRTVNGRSSWERVTRARDILLETGVEVNALVVVNDYSVQFPEEIYQYQRENGLDFMQFIPCVEPDPERPGQPSAFSVSPDAYGDFLVRLFDCWYSDLFNPASKSFVRWFESLFFTYVGLTPPECTLMPECGIYTVVEHNGDVYACDFFVDPEWRLGNVMENSIVECLNSSLQNRFGQEKGKLPQDCLDCPWLSHCYGGCPKERVLSGRDRMSYFCKSYKHFFEYADPLFRTLAESWKSEQLKQKVQTGIQETGLQVGRNDPCPCGSGKKYKLCCGL